MKSNTKDNFILVVIVAVIIGVGFLIAMWITASIHKYTEQKEAEQYAENLIEGFMNFEEVYYQVN